MRSAKVDVADARQPHEGFEPRAERKPEPHRLGEPARDQRGARIAAELLPGGNAARDRQHVLQHAAQLRADQVVGQVDAEARAADRAFESGAEHRVGAGERDAGRQIDRDLAGEGRSAEHGDRRIGQRFGEHLRHQRRTAALDALRAAHHRHAARKLRTQRLRDAAHVLRWRRQHDELRAACGERDVAGREDAFRQRHAAQEGRVAALAVDRGDDFGLACPQHDVVTAPAQHARHRRAESTAADDSDPRHETS
ncbi:MAG: hypothetical protein L6Q72_13785 [Burkholderiaceae bacterium]|nr:hypothetical protein [Burkholderiaceae bacterium]